MLGDEEEGSELELALDGEVLHSQVLLPVVGQALVELAVLLVGDVVRGSGPDRLCLVQLLVLGVFLLHRLLLLLVLVLLVSVLVLADILNLWLLLGLVLLLLLLPLLLLLLLLLHVLFLFISLSRYISLS